MPDQDHSLFGFGLETEYLLADSRTLQPLWHNDLRFQDLNEVLESIPLDGISSIAGLASSPPHRRVMPFVVEGYHVYDEQNQPISLMPKGPEIRTPRASSISECLASFRLLHQRMQTALACKDYVAVALSHHPIAGEFEGPQAVRDANRWQWAKAVMSTYGPDINVSLPEELRSSLDLADLAAKVNYYAPALTALSAASPFYGGQLWRPVGRKHYGRSLRTYKRSLAGPAMRFHPQQGGRLEFKAFEMSCRTEDYHCFFLLWLTLLLDKELEGRACANGRVYDMGLIAQTGLHEDFIRERAMEVIERGMRILPGWGFRPNPLTEMASRIEQRETPADQMIKSFENNIPLNALLRERSRLH